MTRRRMSFLALAAAVLVLAGCTARNATPEPGASFEGTIDLGDKASSATISFEVSEDGASIADLAITVVDLTCDGLSAGRVQDIVEGTLAPTTGGTFSAAMPAIGRQVWDYDVGGSPSDFPTAESLQTVGHIEGRFTSPRRASGTIELHMWVVMTERTCKLGTFSWEAEAP